MSHLSAERLAALVDDAPTPPEAAHLAACGECTRERIALDSLSRMAQDAPDIGVPLTTWETLAPRLRAESLIKTNTRPMAIVPAARAGSRWWLQAAAAVLLVTGGMLAGRMTASHETTQNVASADSVPTFGSVTEAEAAAVRAENVHRVAMAYIAEHETPGAIDTPRSLVAKINALGTVYQVANEALRESPNDAYISNVALTSGAQREAMIRQLNTIMPSSLRMTVY